MTPIEFRKELVKIMPGYKWTVKNTPKYMEAETYLCAVGIQASGFNRTSTLQVEWRYQGGSPAYEVKSSGFGRRSSWLSSAENTTLARALRDLQEHYQRRAATYSAHASDLQLGRQKVAE